MTPPRRFDGIAAAGIPLVLALLLGAAAPASPGAPQRQAMPEPPASPGAAALPSPVPARLEGPVRVGWRRSGSRFEAEVLGTFEITAQGRLVAGTPDAVLRVWRRRPDGSERLYVAGAAPGGIRLAVGWTGDASLAPGAGESALWSDFILPDLVAAASRGARVDTVTSAERERALRALRASGGEGSIGRDRAAFTARVRHALTAVLPPRLRAHDVIIADIALELWTELHVTILWPARDGGSHGPIGIQGNAHLTVIHGESEELIAEVSTRGGPLSRRLPLVAQRRFGAAGLPLDPALLPSLERAGSEITADWESHYQRRRDGQ